MSDLFRWVKSLDPMYTLFMCLIATYLLGFESLIRICIIASIAWWLLSTFKNGINPLKKLHFLTVSFFFIYAISLFWSADYKDALPLIETKLFLLFGPLIAATYRFKHGSDSNLKTSLIDLLAYLLFILLLGALFIAFNHYKKVGDIGFLYNDNLSYILGKQAVYMGIIINFCLIFFLLNWDGLLSKISSNKQAFKIALIMLLFVFNYLLASRSSLILFILILFGFGWSVVKSYSLRTKFSLGIISLGFIVGVIYLNPKVLNRFKYISNFNYQMENKEEVNHFNSVQSEKKWNGTNARLATWECVLSSVKVMPWFGYGIGDVQKELLNTYKAKKFFLGVKNEYNCHNQYLDVLLTSGYLGLLLFLVVFIVLLVVTWKRSKEMFLCLIVLLVSSFTENVFNRFQGVVLVGIVLTIISFLLLSKERKTTE